MNTIISIYEMLSFHKKQHTIIHSKNVTECALSLCPNDDILKNKLKLACALHDISVIIPKEEWINTCISKGIEVIEEEKLFPLLLHQKLSAHIAKDLFNIKDEEVLSAISCHTTLKAESFAIDLILFISDKIAWDGMGNPPWLKAVNDGLEQSLHQAALKLY